MNFEKLRPIHFYALAAGAGLFTSFFLFTTLSFEITYPDAAGFFKSDPMWPFIAFGYVITVISFGCGFALRNVRQGNRPGFLASFFRATAGAFGFLATASLLTALVYKAPFPGTELTFRGPANLPATMIADGSFWYFIIAIYLFSLASFGLGLIANKQSVKQKRKMKSSPSLEMPQTEEQADSLPPDSKSLSAITQFETDLSV